MVGRGGIKPPTSAGLRPRRSFSELPARGGEAAARPADFRAEARCALYTTSPCYHWTASANSGFQSGNFLNVRRASPVIGSVANAVAWLPKSSSRKR